MHWLLYNKYIRCEMAMLAKALVTLHQLNYIINSRIHCYWRNSDKGKVFDGQELPSGESTTTECGVNCQLLAVITKVTQWGTPSCSRPQPATDNGIRDGRSNWLVAPTTLMSSTPCVPRIARCRRGLHIAILAAATGARTFVHGYARPTHCLCEYHYTYKTTSIIYFH